MTTATSARLGQHKLAGEDEIKKAREHYPTHEHAATSAAMLMEARPRPELAGLRVKSPNNLAIYLINPEGYRCWIPNQYTFELLFRDWRGIISDIGVTDIAVGPQLSHGAMCVVADGSSPVYIVSNGHKRWVTSGATMDKYNFKWPAGGTPGGIVSQAVVDAIPGANQWS